MDFGAIPESAIARTTHTYNPPELVDTITVRHVSGGLSLTVWSATVVPIPLFLLSLALDGPTGVADALTGFTWQAVVSTLYTAGLASLVGYGIFNTLLGRNPSSSVVPWVLLAPVVAMASAWLLLVEVPAPGELLGGGVLVVGVLIALRPAARTPCSRPSTDPTPDPVGARTRR